MKHRVLAILLAATMCMASVTGCGKQFCFRVNAFYGLSQRTADKTKTNKTDFLKVHVTLSSFRLRKYMV